MSYNPDQPELGIQAQRRRAEITAEIGALLASGCPCQAAWSNAATAAPVATAAARRPAPTARPLPAPTAWPLPAWTRKVGGRTVTRSLSTEQAARYQPWIDTNRRLRELITELHQLAVEQAETTEGWPRTRPPAPPIGAGS